MKERPILFNGAMVQAILEDRKTNTRREMKPQPDESGSNGGKITGVRSSSLGWGFDANYFGDNPKHVGQCPFGKPGDRLWVRESWRTWSVWDEMPPRELAPCNAIKYSDDVTISTPLLQGEWGKRRPGIFMPRWASRITLEIVSVRVERLNQISEEDAKAEGMIYHNGGEVGHSGWRPTTGFGTVGPTPIHAFAWLWQSVYGPGSFDDRWVWVVEFKRL